MLVHIAVRPYVSGALNLFDSCMFVTLTLVILLLIIETTCGSQSSAILATAIILIIMPIFTFLIMVVYFHRANIKKLVYFFINAIKKSRRTTDPDRMNNMDIEMCEHDVVVDQKLREGLKSTTV